jgi:hypothetical protein
MKRWLLPAALAVLIVGVVLTLAGNYGRQLVHDQLAAQKIRFAPYDQPGQNGDNYAAYPRCVTARGPRSPTGSPPATSRPTATPT